MTFFFFVLGLEARREFDLGDFREPPRFVLPSLASVVGMGAAAAIYLAFNLGSSAEGCYVWRHPPLADGHRHAELAALASEAAADHGAFPGMHDQLLEHQDKPRMADLVSHAERLGLDVARFTEQLQGHVGANRIAQDVEGADLSRVTPRRRRPRQAGGVVALTCLAGCGPSSQSGSARGST